MKKGFRNVMHHSSITVVINFKTNYRRRWESPHSQDECLNLLPLNYVYGIKRSINIVREKAGFCIFFISQTFHTGHLNHDFRKKRTAFTKLYCRIVGATKNYATYLVSRSHVCRGRSV